MTVMPTRDDETFMRLAIDACRSGIEQAQTPFGAAIVLDGKAIAVTHNHVWRNVDITAHAEVHCMREACQALDTVDLSGCTIYSTTEPCPMCFAAIHWARIERIVFGASIADAAEAGFSELPLSNEKLKELTGASVAIEGGCLRDECAGLFQEWKQTPGSRSY